MSSLAPKPEEVGPVADARVPSTAAVRPFDSSSPPASFAPLTMKSLAGPTPTLLQGEHVAKEAPTEAGRGEGRAAPPVGNGNGNGSRPGVAPIARTTGRHPGEAVAEVRRGGPSPRSSRKDGGSGAGAMEESAGEGDSGQRGLGEMIVGRPGEDRSQTESCGAVEVEEGRTAEFATLATADPSQRRIGDRKDEDKDPPPKGVSGGNSSNRARDREAGLGVKGGSGSGGGGGGGGRDAPPRLPAPEDIPATASAESLPAKRDDTEALFFIGGEGGHGDSDAEGDGDRDEDARSGFDRMVDGDPMGPASGPAEGEKSQTVPRQDGGGGAGGEPSPGGSRSGAGGSSSSAGRGNGRPPMLKVGTVASGIGEVMNGLAEARMGGAVPGARIRAEVASSSEHTPRQSMLRDMRPSRSTTDFERSQPPSLLRSTSKYMHEDLAEAKRKQSLRARAKRHKKLSFADEHGDALHETEYHPELYYSKDGVSPPRSSRGCCTIS